MSTTTKTGTEQRQVYEIRDKYAFFMDPNNYSWRWVHATGADASQKEHKDIVNQRLSAEHGSGARQVANEDDILRLAVIENKATGNMSLVITNFFSKEEFNENLLFAKGSRSEHFYNALSQFVKEGGYSCAWAGSVDAHGHIALREIVYRPPRD